MIKNNWFILAAVLLAAACKPGTKKNEGENKPPAGGSEKTTTPAATAPRFSADTAYDFVKAQVDFGPRVPNTAQHENCAAFLVKELKKYTDTVVVQRATAKTFDGKTINMSNIVGSINPKAGKRVLLCAHWDTRPFADKDTKDKDKPILGANDGASGVGVLLEIARQLSITKTSLGIDIIFFDGEDWGGNDVENSYCLGSQYWARNPHTPYYNAEYGILLDMVGAKGATFLMEGISRAFARKTLYNVWEKAAQLNHGNYFLYAEYPEIIDDHYYINSLRGIPTIDIIQLVPNGGFGSYHHTHADNMDVIDKNTLKAVGETLLKTLYEEHY